MRLALGLVVAVLVGGCGSSHQSQLQSAQMNEAMALNEEIIACRTRYSQRVKGQAAAGIRCATAAYDRHPMAYVGNRDLVKLFAAKSIGIAEKFDSGEISLAEFDRQIELVDAEFQVASRGRQSQDMALAAAQEQAAAARQQAAMQGIMAGAAIMSGAYSRPPPPPPMPRQTNCTTFGNRTNCSTW